jgi:hypothetical protein
VLSVIRTLLVVIGLVAAVVWLEPTLYAEKRSVLLRLRTPEEVVQSVRERSRALGARFADAIEDADLPAVGAPAEKKRSSENHTTEEKDRLNRLVEQVTREP